MYYLLYGFFYVISLLPFWFIYLISDVAYVFIYYVVGYRKAIVLSNLAIAFPEKTLEERKVIAKQFYKNFTDNFIETIKLLSVSKKQMQKRFIVEYDLINHYYEEGRNIQLHLGHFFNWEYANFSLGINSKYTPLIIYMPILNKSINRLYAKLRTRFNSKLIAATFFLREFKPYKDSRYCLVFLGDQSAGNISLAYWLPFFNKLTPFVTGPEKSAKLNNTVALYANFSKTKRGYYNAKLHLLSDEPRQLAEAELTKIMINHIEENIKEQPSDYLWSHRRWKHEFNPNQHRAY